MGVSQQRTVGAILGVLALGTLPGAARAGFAFQALDPTGHGVLTTKGQQSAIDAMANNPARAALGVNRATLRQFGSSFTFGATLSATGEAQQAFTAGGLEFQFPQFSELPFTIVGTAGEPAGTPVTVYLTSLASAGGGAGFIMTVNTAAQSVNQRITLNGFKVGDEIDFGALADDPRASGATLTATLSFQPLGGPSAAPEPGTLGLLFAGGAFAGLSRRRPKGICR